jgi:hypothetical protein
MIGYVIQINILISCEAAGANDFQYRAPIVLGIISLKKRIANVRTTETMTTASFPQIGAA